MKQWRHYLQGANHKVLIQCNNKNLEYFQTSEVLYQRQTRLAEILSSYDYVIEHLQGKKTPGVEQSRRPDYEISYEGPTMRLLETLVTTTVELYHDLLQEIKTAHAIDKSAADVKFRITGTPIVDIPDQERIDVFEEDTSNKMKVTTRVLTYNGRIYIQIDDLLLNKVISCFHGNPECGHFRSLKTAELVTWDFYWPAMDPTIRKYIAGCDQCRQIEAQRHAHYGTTIPLPPLSPPWEGVTMDCVMDIPESTVSGNMGILVVID